MMSNITKLLETYDKVMCLKIYVDGDEDLKQKYCEASQNHNEKINNQLDYIDAGFDLYTPEKRLFYGPGWYDPETYFDENNCKIGDVIKMGGTMYIDNSNYNSKKIDCKHKTLMYIDNPVNKIDYKIKCRAVMYTDKDKVYNTGYYLYPRSSLSKTRLRLANSTGIIDSGYSGRIMAMFDVGNIMYNRDCKECDYVGEKYDRYLQICAPGLVPILVEVVESEHDLGVATQRGAGGFGSTGR
jgi:dUTPase